MRRGWNGAEVRLVPLDAPGVGVDIDPREDLLFDHVAFTAWGIAAARRNAVDGAVHRVVEGFCGGGRLASGRVAA